MLLLFSLPFLPSKLAAGVPAPRGGAAAARRAGGISAWSSTHGRAQLPRYLLMLGGGGNARATSQTLLLKEPGHSTAPWESQPFGIPSAVVGIQHGGSLQTSWGAQLRDAIGNMTERCGNGNQQQQQNHSPRCCLSFLYILHLLYNPKLPKGQLIMPVQGRKHEQLCPASTVISRVTRTPRHPQGRCLLRCIPVAAGAGCGAEPSLAKFSLPRL